ncbi:MAG: class I SAM-dependent methyltransferase [Novosphingobium sp.]|jgi:SAM-dependent methyltransferase
MTSLVGQARNFWFKIREQLFLSRYGERKARFAAIYRNNMWKNAESASGFGSTLDATRQAREGLEQLIQQYDVQSILDAPCGDFNWMKELQFDGHYTGGDIVADLIAANNARYASDKSRFQQIDLVADQLPSADLVLCRECLNHLSLAEAAAALNNLVTASRKVLVVTHYPALTANADQETSFRYRPLNLTHAPFNLPKPDAVIDECASEQGKVLGVWDIGKLHG